MTDQFLGTGWAFPIRVDDGGCIALVHNHRDIRESIWIILSTAKGERIMFPDFGCGIHDYVFSVLDTATLTLVETDVREALTRFEPRIRLLKVETNTDDARQGKLNVLIEYEVKSTNNRFNLVYPFYLKEG